MADNPSKRRRMRCGRLTIYRPTLSDPRETSGPRIDRIPSTRPSWRDRQYRELKKIIFSPPSKCTIDLFGPLANRTVLKRLHTCRSQKATKRLVRRPQPIPQLNRRQARGAVCSDRRSYSGGGVVVRCDAHRSNSRTAAGGIRTPTRPLHDYPVDTTCSERTRAPLCTGAILVALLPWLLRASRGRRGACLRPRRSTPLPLMMLCHRRAGRDISRSANNSAGVCATQSSISCVCPWRPKSRAWSSKPSKREFDFVERRTDLLVVDSAPVHLNGAAPQAPATARRGGACRSALPP